VHGSNHKGAIAEIEVAAAAVRLGIPVLRPVQEHGRYDLVFEIAGQLIRVQCKWASLHGDVVQVHVSGNYLTPNGYVRSPYSAAQIDAIAAYCDELDRCYVLPVELVAGKHLIHLRLSPAKNGQRAGLNWAAQYSLEGAIAQLGERRDGIAKGVGSSPTGSTPTDPAVRQVGAHEFRNHFGYYMERAAAGEEILIKRRGKPHARLGPPAASQPELDLAQSTARPVLRPARSPSSDTPSTG
jgi:prevent-host-death family protein